MRKIMIIKTSESEKIENLLKQEKVDHQIVYDDILADEESIEKEDQLAREYQEAWQSPQRLAEAKQWEQAAMNDWAERVKKEKK